MCPGSPDWEALLGEALLSPAPAARVEGVQGEDFVGDSTEKARPFRSTGLTVSAGGLGSQGKGRVDFFRAGDGKMAFEYVLQGGTKRA